MTEMVKYDGNGLGDQQLRVLEDGLMPSNDLRDLNGTFDDIGQLIAYMRDLAGSLKPVAANLNTLLETDIPTWLKDHKGVSIGAGVACVLLAGYFGTGIIKNIQDLRK